MSTRTEDLLADIGRFGAAILDEFGPWLEQALRDPQFRRLYEATQKRHRLSLPLAIDGHDYRRRQLARRRRGGR